MRPNNSSKRTRGRSRSKNTNPLARSYESNGPDVKIRGSALQVADKYAQLARDAQSAGDRVMAENYFQHAEHYYRIVAQAYEQNNQNQQNQQGRDRRDDDRQPYRGGEQPSINGFDGLEDEDEGVRRALRVNGHSAGNGVAQEDEADEDDGPTVTTQSEARESERAEAEPAQTADEAETAETRNPPKRRSRAKADDAPKEAAADGAESANGASEDDAPKPRKRTRSTTRRPRSRSSATSGTAEAATPAPEASDPTN